MSTGNEFRMHSLSSDWSKVVAANGCFCVRGLFVVVFRSVLLCCTKQYFF